MRHIAMKDVTTSYTSCDICGEDFEDGSIPELSLSLHLMMIHHQELYGYKPRVIR